MAMVKIKSGKTVKAGTRSKGGGYEYVVQADGSIKNLTTGRVTSAATGKAPAKAAKPAAKPNAKAAPVPAARIDRSASSAAAPTGPKGRGGPRGAKPVVRPVGFSTTRYGGPKIEMPKPVVPEKSPTSRPRGFTEKKRSGGIFGLDIIKD